MGKVTDPALLEQLEGGGKVTDPALLQQLEAQPQPVSGASALGAGVVQGVSLGFGDEMKAGWRSLFPRDKFWGGAPYGETLQKLRGENAAAKQQHPYLYGAGEIAGGMVPAAATAVATGGTSIAPLAARLGLPLAIGQGAAQGAGYSNATTAGGLARDVGVGAGVGALGYGAGAALGKAGGAVAGWARRKAGSAVGRASEQAAQEVADAVASGRGELGAEVQKGSRYIENLMRLEESMTPEQRALYESLHPEVQKLSQRVAESTLKALPGQAETIASKDAAYEALKSGASAAFKARKDELLQPQFLKDTASLAKSYGEPLVANAALGPTAGIIMGRTRAGKAIMNRLTRPGNQKAIADFIANRAEGPTMTLLRKALQASAAPATQELVTQ